jgi:thymidylate synthase
MNNLDKQYQTLLQTILDFGVEKKDRTGTGTKSIFGYTIRHNMKDGFPLLTTKKMAWKTMVTELLWFLRGDTNIKYLVDNDCHIWDGDAYKNYLKHTITGVENGLDRIKGHLDNCLVEFEGSYEHFTNPSFAYGFRPHTQEEFINKIKTDDEFAYKWGDLGPVYGAQWRSWHWRSEPFLPEEKDMIYTTEDKPVTWSKEKYIDQIANLINDLKTNPDSRRMMVNCWNVGELNKMVLPPCHYGFQVYTRELSLEERYEIHKKYITEDKLDLLFELATNENLDKLGVPKRTISLMWNQRSCDVLLGIPFNIASYGLLLLMIADEVNMVPGELIGNLGDTHLYLNHIEQAKEQIGREPYPLPKVIVQDGIFCSSVNDVILENYQSHPSIKAPLSN